MNKTKEFLKKLDGFSIYISSMIVLALVIVDQLTKYLARSYIQEFERITIIKNILDFSLIYNKGAGYGSFSQNYAFLIMLTFLGLGVIVYLFLYVSLKKKKTYTAGIIFILSGALANALDRLFVKKGVTDFIEFPFLHFTKLGQFTANVADIFVTVGFILFIIHLLFIEIKIIDKFKKTNKEKKNNE